MYIVALAAFPRRLDEPVRTKCCQTIQTVAGSAPESPNPIRRSLFPSQLQLQTGTHLQPPG